MESLKKFADRMKAPKVADEFRKWGLEFDVNMQRVKGRTLQPEKILQEKGRSCSYQVDNAEWSFR